MPANLTPEYRKAEEWFRNADTDDERLLALEEMLRTIPRHKGTDHMRADLRRRLSKLKETLAGPKKHGGKRVDVFHVPTTGAGQVVLLGMPNCGKSSIVGVLTNAKVNIADYPFATDLPTPGMARYEDVSMQIVDMPPVTADYAPPGAVGTYRGSDLIGIVIDLSGEASEQMNTCLDFLQSHRLLIDEQNEETDQTGNILGRKAFVICTKADVAKDGEMEKLKNFCKGRFELVEVSLETGQGVDELAQKMFSLLDIVRVYAKKPGKKADMKDPFTLPRGSTVADLAVSIHRELAEKLKSARAWGKNVHDGQNVHRTYELADRDIIELHFQ
ncbi:MAG TPA: TGS domain-containing protein [Planctomycetes bacterium]|nr:TGS domain-containing protein [Planctomycetota bacterium]